MLVEKDGKKLLIDPGAFSFLEGKVTPDDIGEVHGILITHKHADHYDPSALKRLTQIGQPEIVTIAEVGEELTKDEFTWTEIKPGDERDIAGFRVKALNAPHGPLPSQAPQNAAYFIDGRILHPGDSFSVDVNECEILALPFTAPWARIVDAFDMVERLKPKRVIPIHDAILKDFMIERLYEMMRAAFEAKGISFEPLGVEDMLQLNGEENA